MKEKNWRLNLLLCVLWGLLLAIFVLVRTFFPAAVLLPLDVPLLLAVSLGALLLERPLAPSRKRCWPGVALLAALAFGLLPLCAGLAGGPAAGKLAVVGGITFALTTVVFDSLVSRLPPRSRTGVGTAAAAFVLFLAGQVLTNLFY